MDSRGLIRLAEWIGGIIIVLIELTNIRLQLKPELLAFGRKLLCISAGVSRKVYHG
jgi:hypothetical protein